MDTTLDPIRSMETAEKFSAIRMHSFSTELCIPTDPPYNPGFQAQRKK